jgi:steroid 5-alpha reductase family enzyme
MLTALLYNWVLAAGLMTIGWALYCKLKNPGVVDLFWGIVIAANCLLTIYLGKNGLAVPQIMFVLCIVLWSLRLSIFLLLTRVGKGHVEHRYVEISKSWKSQGNKSFFLHYQVQAILSLFVSTPAYVFAFSAHQSSNIIFFVAAAASIIFIILEWSADQQLHKFSQDVKRGIETAKVCKRGWWAIVRHPNYSFEMLFWLSIAIMALSFDPSWQAFIAPLFLYILMRFVTGRITERESVKRRGEAYTQYQKEVGMFIPRFIKLKRRK